jgi:histidinol-phosphatase (PHP family)
MSYSADYHVHTSFSDDSECPMQDQAEEAVRRGLEEIAFTDHVDYGVKTDLNCDYDAFFSEIRRLQERFRGKLVIKAGMEFGMQKETAARYRKDFARYPFDFILLSNHQIGNREFWNNAYQKGKSQEEYQRGYYRAIYEVMSLYKEYSVLAHLDMIKRYDRCGDYPDEKIMEYVDPILKKAIADGKGIEVNTSCFRYGLKDLTPSRNILKRYLELGGNILTIGSDTHDTEHLADHLDFVKAELKRIGFTGFCTFDRMKPEFHAL